MNRRPTIKDVAAHAGVHHSTVSLALRNHPSIPETTRARIRASAETVGYRPDPMLRSLMAYRRGIQTQPGRTVVAWVTNYPTRTGWRRTRVFAELHAGAARRAEELGFKLEEFWLREGGMSLARANQILDARNITALLIAPQPEPNARLDLNWAQVSAVTFGYTLASPRLHLVTNHQFASMCRLVQELLALGYRRPALALPKSLDQRVHHGWLGGFLAEQAYLPLRQRTRPWLFDAFALDTLGRWLGREKPDVLISPTEDVWRGLPTLGYRVPDDLGFALPSRPTPDEPRAGVDENSQAIGAAAMELLAGLWQRNERGIPAVPQRLLIEGLWRPGPSVRDQSAVLAAGR